MLLKPKFVKYYNIYKSSNFEKMLQRFSRGYIKKCYYLYSIKIEPFKSLTIFSQIMVPIYYDIIILTRGRAGSVLTCRRMVGSAVRIRGFLLLDMSVRNDVRVALLKNEPTRIVRWNLAVYYGRTTFDQLKSL